MGILAENKALAGQLLDAFSRGDIAGMTALMTADASWTVTGRVKGVSGTYSRDEFASLAEGAKAAYKSGALAIWPTGMTAEDNRVAVEAESRSELHDGRVYNNFYHLLLTVRDGKVASVKEYMDTQHLKEVFVDGA